MRGRIHLTAWLVVGATGVLAWWALRPLPAVSAGAGLALESVPRGEAGAVPAALDVAAFHVPVWIAPPAPPPPAPAPKPAPEPPPFKLQVLAIVEDGAGEGHRALMYDPESDRPFWVHGGSEVGSRSILRVNAESVEVRDGALTRTLVLRDHRPADGAVERAIRGIGGAP